MLQDRGKPVGFGDKSIVNYLNSSAPRELQPLAGGHEQRGTGVHFSAPARHGHQTQPSRRAWSLQSADASLTDLPQHAVRART